MLRIGAYYVNFGVSGGRRPGGQASPLPDPEFPPPRTARFEKRHGSRAPRSLTMGAAAQGSALRLAPWRRSAPGRSASTASWHRCNAAPYQRAPKRRRRLRSSRPFSPPVARPARTATGRAGAAGKRDDRLRLRLPHRGRPGLRRLRVARGARGALPGARGAGRPVELVLAGDFFDFLQQQRGPRRREQGLAHDVAGGVPRPLRGARRVSVGGWEARDLPSGNHDAEAWWNPDIQKTLREAGVVDEFAYSYLAYLEVGGRRRAQRLRARQPVGPAEHRRGLLG